LIITGGILLLICSLLLLLPVYVKHYINKNGQELTGRTLKLAGCYHNPLTGYTRLTDFSMLEAGDSADFVSLDTLVINFDFYKLLGGTFSISELRLVNPNLQIYHRDTVYNFNDLIERFTENSGEEADSTDSGGLDIELKNISLTGGAVEYYDLVKVRDWLLDDVNMAIPDLYFDNQDTDADLNLAFTDGGELRSNIQYNNQQGTYDLNLELTGFNLAAAKEYIQDYLNISDFGASLDANLDISGKVGSPELLKLTGTVDVRDYFFQDLKNQQPFKGEAVTVVLEEVLPIQEKTLISSITILKPQLLYEIYVDSTDNIVPLFKTDSSDSSPQNPDPEMETTSEDSYSNEEPQILIREFVVSGGKLIFRDHNPQTPFEYEFYDIESSVTNIAPGQKSLLALTSKAPEDGDVELNWEGDVFDLSQQSFTLKTNIPGLPAFSPYTISFFDVPINQGHFSYTSTNHINNGSLEGLHTIIASNMDVGDRTGFKSLYDVPLKIGLYLLEDRNGDIHLEIPVDGDVNDPNYRYSKIVVKAVLNGLAKLITSPVALIGKLVGAGDDFKDMEYNPINPEITPDLESKLKYLVDASEQKPDLRFELIQHFDRQQAREDMALYLVKQGYYRKTHDNTSIEDFYMINNIDEKDEEFQTYVATEAGQEVGNTKDLIASCLELKESEANQAVDTLAQAWNNLVSAHLLEKEISEQSLVIEPAENDKGKFEFELAVELKD